MQEDDQKTTHFGYQQVPSGEKADKVAAVFTKVAPRYDIMNDLMSLGLHRIWKKIAISLGQVRTGHAVLDLAGGSGDLAARIIPLVGPKGRVVLSDINHAMLACGRDRLTNMGFIKQIEYVQANAEQLPFEDNTFDRSFIGFGLRNVTDKQKALNSMYRTLAPGGCVIVLEFSTPTMPVLKPIYDAYSFKILLWLGKVVAQDADSYRYLAESIRMHPDQETLKNMMQQAGFERCSYHNLTGGIVAIHRGYKF